MHTLLCRVLGQLLVPQPISEFSAEVRLRVRFHRHSTEGLQRLTEFHIPPFGAPFGQVGKATIDNFRFNPSRTERLVARPEQSDRDHYSGLGW